MTLIVNIFLSSWETCDEWKHCVKYYWKLLVAFLIQHTCFKTMQLLTIFFPPIVNSFWRPFLVINDWMCSKIVDTSFFKNVYHLFSEGLEKQFNIKTFRVLTVHFLPRTIKWVELFNPNITLFHKIIVNMWWWSGLSWSENLYSIPVYIKVNGFAAIWCRNIETVSEQLEHIFKLQPNDSLHYLWVSNSKARETPSSAFMEPWFLTTPFSHTVGSGPLLGLRAPSSGH